MTTKNRNQTLAVLFVGVLMGALDIAIVGPALPAIQSQFGLSSRNVSWIFSIYVLTNLIGTPLMAKLSDFHGRRAIYILDVGLFAVGSLLVAGSQSLGLLWVLLLGRAIQGFGAGGIFPVASAVIGDTFPAEKRGGALGLIGAVFGMAFLIGPIVGGVLLGFGWQWLFLINLPIAAVVIALAWRLLPHTRVAGDGEFDWTGMLILAVALGSLAYGLNQIDTAHFWASLTSVAVLPWLLLCVLAWAALIAVEQRAAHPVFPTHLFRRRQLALGYTLTAGAGLGEASLVFIPSLAVLALGVSAAQASYLLLPVVLAMAVGSPLAGRLLDRLGSRTVITAGISVMSLGMILLSQASGWLPAFIGAGVLIGIGLSSLLGAPIRYVTLNETTREERSSAQGLVAVFTSLGQLVGSAVVGAVAASAGSTTTGYEAAFGLIGIFGILLLAAAVLLKPKAAEREPAARETARAGQRSHA